LRLSVHVAPGLRQGKPADVMRGEETQIAGFLALNPNWDGVICLPGTHSKWVHISAGEVVSFQTFLTGEMFALLSQASVLRHGMQGDGWDDAAFDAMAAQGAFALHWGAHGLHYAIPATVRADLAAGRDMLANLSRAALPAAKAQFDPFMVIQLTARRDVLAARLAARGREAADDIARRLDRADHALPAGIEAVTIDNSGDLDTTVGAVLRLLYPVKA
jgi:phosphonate metabolism protein PhnN/1,5-bisphosphokinase (PRPP-forming)